MRLLFLYVVMLLVCVVMTGYIPDPRDPELLIPVRRDPERPRVRLQRVLVEDAPNRNRVLELMYLMFAVPLLFTGGRNGMFGGDDDDSPGGNGGVITENPCCG